jgi:iron complex transport system ATP-binding protein
VALVVENLELTRGKKCLFNRLSMEFSPGEVWGILGCNGSGKTSLLHTLAGIIPPNAGTIKLNHQHLTTRASRQRALEIALLLQHYDDTFPATVMETVLIGRHPHYHYFHFESTQDRAIVNRILQQLEILALQNRDIRTLSGGERQRVAIAMVLAQQTNYYLLDEP